MGSHDSLWAYIYNAGPVVKLVMLILFSASILSWTFIFERAWHLKNLQKALDSFETRFWSGGNLTQLYTELQQSEPPGLAVIFKAGFKEFMRLEKQYRNQPELIMEGSSRAMRIATAHETQRLENYLPFLASVGSVSPYIGLFGTVWGIMTAFHALGNVQQASISMVAPGISEALIATAIGLFAAIPAVLAYNRYTSWVNRIMQHYDTFQEEFYNILHRQAHNPMFNK